jgi:hypothetical protein
VRVPAEAAFGLAKITLSFADCEEAEVAPAQVEVAIVESKTAQERK